MCMVRVVLADERVVLVVLAAAKLRVTLTGHTHAAATTTTPANEMMLRVAAFTALAAAASAQKAVDDCSGKPNDHRREPDG